MDAQIVSLETLGGGAAVERFNYELQRVLDNIGDINTKPTAARKVQLTITIAPNEERTGAAVLIDVKSTLASIKSEATRRFTSAGSRRALRPFTRPSLHTTASTATTHTRSVMVPLDRAHTGQRISLARGPNAPAVLAQVSGTMGINSFGQPSARLAKIKPYLRLLFITSLRWRPGVTPGQYEPKGFFRRVAASALGSCAASQRGRV